MVDRLAPASMMLIAILWGSTFFVLKDMLTRIDASDLLAVRFTIAALVLGASSVLAYAPTGWFSLIWLTTRYQAIAMPATSPARNIRLPMSTFTTWRAPTNCRSQTSSSVMRPSRCTSTCWPSICGVFLMRPSGRSIGVDAL